MKGVNSIDKHSDDYHIIRHLFNEARKSSVTDKMWGLNATHSIPGDSMFTEYVHIATHDTISCYSYQYCNGEYNRHNFVFTQGVKE